MNIQAEELLLLFLLCLSQKIFAYNINIPQGNRQNLSTPYQGRPMFKLLVSAWMGLLGLFVLVAFTAAFVPFGGR